MFSKILIANRAEIACRIMRTADRMGISTVAIYSDADRDAMHVLKACEAWHIGASPAAMSYLRRDRVIETALKSGAQAIHPGYGFLAENPEFAEDCRKAGLVFIGPTPEAIRVMGHKASAKKIMGQAAIPLLKGYHEGSHELKALQHAALGIGYPLLIKPSSGGGGKGMRLVLRESELEAALKGARREAQSAFSDTDLILEKYLLRPRHIEIQIFADSHGNAIHLFERDCSLQRRHQKIIEESPATNLSADLRGKMGRAAVSAAKAIGYVGAGTVEFLLDEKDQFYFMEMNTRLQVEHPVTEMITGLDLVEWQFRVAAGEPLPMTQEELAINGHSLEARIYAEDPERNFLPSTGELVHLRYPDEDGHIRIDSGVRQGDTVGIHYDPLLAKLIVWDVDRPSAVFRLQRALSQCQFAGVVSNLDFLSNLVEHPAFSTGGLDTTFVDRHQDELVTNDSNISNEILALAALTVMRSREEKSREHLIPSSDQFSPWQRSDGWRLNAPRCSLVHFRFQGVEIKITILWQPDGYIITLPEADLTVRGELQGDGELKAEVDGRQYRADVVWHGDEIIIFSQAKKYCLHYGRKESWLEVFDSTDANLNAPMPGEVVALPVAVGKQVTKGTVVVVLEAMKMEHAVLAPGNGYMDELFCKVGDVVKEGKKLFDFIYDKGA